MRAKELKAAGMNWTDVLAIEDENPRARLAAELLASNAHGSTAERVKAFVEQGGGCRATFFNCPPLWAFPPPPGTGGSWAVGTAPERKPARE